MNVSPRLGLRTSALCVDRLSRQRLSEKNDGTGVGWKRIAVEMGVGFGTLYRVALDGSKIREGVF